MFDLCAKWNVRQPLNKKKEKKEKEKKKKQVPPTIQQIIFHSSMDPDYVTKVR